MFRMKAKTKRIVILVGAILLTVLAVVGLSKVTGVADWNFRKVNPDNLYQDFTFVKDEGVLNDGDQGVVIEIDEDHVVKVDGKAKSTVTETIASGTLKAGTAYVFDSGLKDGSKATVYMSVRNTTTDTVIASSYRGAVVIEALEADTAVTIEVTVVEDTEVNEKLRPVLNKGDDAKDIISFWK